MKKIFTVLILTVALSLSIEPSDSRADGSDKDKSNDLTEQIVLEIKEVLSTPYLKYEDKDLSGKVTVYTTVDKNGKIEFTGLKGVNENLIMNISSKLNSLNLWTSPDYSDLIFQYNINYLD